MAEKMSKQCFACGEIANKENRITLHEFPKEPETLEKWKKFCSAFSKLKEDHQFANRRICSRHFTPDSYNFDSVLNKSAYPTKLILINKIGIFSGDSCFYADCNIHKKNRDVTSFFKLPIHNKELCKSWIQNSGRPDLEPLVDNFNRDLLAKLIICEKHFDTKDILVNNKRKLLFRNSVPKVYNAAPTASKPPQTAPQVQASSIKQSILEDKSCCVRGCKNTSWATPDRSFHFGVKIPNKIVKDLDESKRDRSKINMPPLPSDQNIPDHTISIDYDESQRDLSKINLPPFPPGQTISDHDYANLNYIGNSRPKSSKSVPFVANSQPMKRPIPVVVQDKYCKKCREQQQKELTDNEKKAVVYYFTKISEYKEKYQKQYNSYKEKTKVERQRVQSLEKELEEISKVVEILRKAVDT